MILVSGGTGVMGSRLVQKLAERGWDVRVLALPNDPFLARLEDIKCEICFGDINDVSSLKDVFNNIETVYHLAAIIISQDPKLFRQINIIGTRNMVDSAISAGVKHFILVSSASVVYPKTTEYSISKRECETIVREQNAMNYTIVRPTLAYEEKGGQEFLMFLDYLQKYPIVPFIGMGRALKNPVYVGDLIDGFLALAGNEKSFGKTYNFSGGEEISVWKLSHLMLKHHGMTKVFVPIPIWLCKLLSVCMGVLMKHPPLTWNAIAGLTQDANLDHSSASQDLGYHPIGITAGLQKCFPL